VESETNDLESSLSISAKKFSKDSATSFVRPKVDLYLSGFKGLSAAQALLDARNNNSLSIGVGRAWVLSDPGLLDDPSDRIIDLVRQCGAEVVEGEPLAIGETIALAVGWRRLISAPYSEIFVVHDSLLPKLRGWNPLVTALINEDRQIGSTLFLATEEMDKGPIVGQVKLQIEEIPNLRDATQMINQSISQLISIFLSDIEKSKITFTPQEENDATYSLWRDEIDFQIDWQGTAESIHRHIESVGWPYRGATANLNEHLVRVLESEPLREDRVIVNRTAGKVFLLEAGIPTVVCGQGLIKLLNITDEFGKSLLPLNKLRTRFS